MSLIGLITKALTSLVTVPQVRAIQGLEASQGDLSGKRLNGNVEWDQTMKSLDRANFPHDQILDFLPDASQSWTYVAQDWLPSWDAQRAFYEEQPLQGLSCSDNGSFSKPLDAFPGFRDTFELSWLDPKIFRQEIDANFKRSNEPGPQLRIRDVMYSVLFQSEPSLDNRMKQNNATLQLSMTALHLHNVSISHDTTQSSARRWKPYRVDHAAFSRIECNFTRARAVKDATTIPWIWTNDTVSITTAYSTNWMTEVERNSSRYLDVMAPTPEKLFRFYQAYMVSVSTWSANPTLKDISVWAETVQIPIVGLIVLSLIILWELWMIGQYFMFVRRNKQRLSEICVPNGRIEWMIQAARVAQLNREKETSPAAYQDDVEEGERVVLQDRDYFTRAAFGKLHNPKAAHSQLAQVYTVAGLRSCERSRSRPALDTQIIQGQTPCRPEALPRHFDAQ